MRITYEIITPASAEQGDSAENGFVDPGTLVHIPIDDMGSVLPSSLEWRLADAERFVGRGGCEDGGRWFTQADGSTDHRTGAETRYSVHPGDDVTSASYARLKRIFCL